MKKLFSSLLIVLLILPLCLTVMAERGDINITPREDAFMGGSAQYTHDDGSVTTIYYGGAVGTRYADGSFEGIDYDGNRYTEDKDGTYTVYSRDGSIAVERPDGTQELTERNGTKYTYNPDGSGKTTYSNGLVIEHDSDYTQTSAYFEGSKDRLTADENGNFPVGEITGKNGEKLTNTENGLYIKGANGTEYEVNTADNTASIKHADGSYIKSENGNAEMKLSDGSVFTSTGGVNTFTTPDGSYVSIDDYSEAWSMFNSGDGTYVSYDKNGELTDFTQSSGGNSIVIEDGEVKEWRDADAGITITRDENGTTVKTPDGTYFTDGKGNITKDGKPLENKSEKKEPSYESSSAGAPEGYVPMSEVFRLEDGDGSQPYDYGKVDGFYLVLDHMTSEVNTLKYADAFYGIAPRINPDYQVASQSIDGHPSVSFTREGTTKAVSASGTYSWQHNYTSESQIHKDGENVLSHSELTLTVSNFTFEDYRVYADVTGHVSAQSGENSVYNKSDSASFSASHVMSNLRFDSDNEVVYLAFYVTGELNELNSAHATAVFRIDGVLPKGAEVEEEEPDEGDDYVKYSGRLTYTNGAYNKHGQPWPDMMDFDGDGDIDYADRVIQHILVHNPDALDTPQGFVLVASTLIAVLLGVGGGTVMSLYSSALSAAGSGVDLSLEFSDDDDDSDDEADSGSEPQSPDGPQDPGGYPDVDRGPTDDLGPYINRDKEGDLHVKDPATGEERTYIANGDGTYTNPMTGATYTEGELKSSLESRAENAGLIRQDAAAAKEAVESQREENQGKSLLTQKLEAEEAARLAEEERNADHEKYVRKLEDEHGVYSGTDDLYAKIGQKKNQAEVEGYEWTEMEKEYHKSQTYTENVKKGADIGIDVLAEIEPTGTGKKIKDGYTVLSAAASNAGEVMAGDKTVAGAIWQTGVDAGLGLAKNHSDKVNLTGTGGYAEKAVLNTMGDGLQAVSNELVKGGSLEDARKAGSNAAAQGVVNTVVDAAFDGLGGKFGSESGDRVGSILGSEISKKGTTEGAKALGADLVKNGLTPDDPDDVKLDKLQAANEKAEQDANAEAAARFREAQKEWAERKAEQDADGER